MLYPTLTAEQSGVVERYLSVHGQHLHDEARAIARAGRRGLVSVIFRPGTACHPSEVEYLDADHPDVVRGIEVVGEALAERLAAYDPEREMVLVVIFDDPVDGWSGFCTRLRGVRLHEIPLDDRELVRREMEAHGSTLLRPRGGFGTRD
jgi:hypothetical protein